MPRGHGARIAGRDSRDKYALSAPELVENFFRHEYGRLVAVLSRQAGLRHLAAVEDAVQSALMKALQTWTIAGRPDQPSAWLYRVAHNNLVSELRQRDARTQILQRYPPVTTPSAGPNANSLMPGEVSDDLLRMLFVCCNDAVPDESQPIFALKTLCGFSVREISLRLFLTEANVYKRLTRARSRLRDHQIEPGELTPEDCAARLPAVHRILYLIFTEGHLSAHVQFPIRRELCDEAIRLGELLARHEIGQTPETYALLALMNLHSARMTARECATGGLLLLEEQDRALWNRNQMMTGFDFLARSATGDCFSRYHAEAGIVAEHCRAESFAETRWDRVVDCYLLLERIQPSPIHRMNRAVATAEWQGPEAGLAVLHGFEPPGRLAESYLWAAVNSDLHRRCGNREKAASYREAALNAAPSPAIQTLLRRRLANTSAPSSSAR